MTHVQGATEVAGSDVGTRLAAEGPRLFAIAVAILREPAEAEDAVQETLTIAWRKWRTVRDEAARPRWLTQICVRQALTIRRRLRLLRSELDPRLAAPTVALRDPDLDRVYTRLSVRQRAVLTLHYHHGYSLDEAATLMGCRPGTARSHLARALATLRKELDGGQ
jgi:RNA polymerase sigma-70 factor (ECF subfamily)